METMQSLVSNSWIPVSTGHCTRAEKLHNLNILKSDHYHWPSEVILRSKTIQAPQFYPNIKQDLFKK